MSKLIRIPPRTLAEQVSPVEQILILPQQKGRVVLSTEDGQQFETVLSSENLDTLFGWITPAVTDKYADATVEDEEKPAPAKLAVE